LGPGMISMKNQQFEVITITAVWPKSCDSFNQNTRKASKWRGAIFQDQHSPKAQKF